MGSGSIRNLVGVRAELPNTEPSWRRPNFDLDHGSDRIYEPGEASKHGADPNLHTGSAQPH